MCTSIHNISTPTSIQRQMMACFLNNCTRKCVTNALCNNIWSSKPKSTHNMRLIRIDFGWCTLQLPIVSYAISTECCCLKFSSLLLHFSTRYSSFSFQSQLSHTLNIKSFALNHFSFASLNCLGRICGEKLMNLSSTAW